MIVTADGRRYEGVTADESDKSADEEERFDSMPRASPSARLPLAQPTADLIE
jgi:hypothetical protein